MKVLKMAHSSFSLFGTLRIGMLVIKYTSKEVDEFLGQMRFYNFEDGRLRRVVAG